MRLLYGRAVGFHKQAVEEDGLKPVGRRLLPFTCPFVERRTHTLGTNMFCKDGEPYNEDSYMSSGCVCSRLATSIRFR